MNYDLKEMNSVMIKSNNMCVLLPIHHNVYLTLGRICETNKHLRESVVKLVENSINGNKEGKYE